MKRILLTFVITIASATAFSLEPGKPFPKYSLKTMEGKITSLNEASTGKKLTLVEFWASWCGSCKKSVPFLNELKKKYEKRGLKISAINTDLAEDFGDVKSFIKDTKPEFDIYYGNTDEIYKKSGLKGVPYAALVDSNGKVLSVYESMKTKIKKKVEQDIQKHLAL